MTALLTEGCLKAHPFLEGCSSNFLNHLEEFARDVDFNEGDTILREGDYADRFYLICTGTVSLESATNGSPGINIQSLGPGDVLGWSWMYAPYEWHFTARATSQCHAVELNAASLLIRAEEDRAFGYELMKRLSKHLIHRLQATRERLVSEVKMRKGSD